MSTAVDDKKCGVDARYSRAMIDISRLKKHLEDSIEDFIYFITNKTMILVFFL